MAFNPNPPKVEYQATAGQTNFPFLFKIYFTSDMNVYHTPISTNVTTKLTEGVDYSVVINGDDGGTVTLILVVENNDYIVLERELELTRYVEYQTSGDLLAYTLNADQDYQTYLTSDQNSKKDNSLHFPDGTVGITTELPLPIANSFFKWSADGKSVEYSEQSSFNIPWGNIIGTLSDQTDLQNALNLKADKTYVDAEDVSLQNQITSISGELDSKLPIANPTFTGTLSGQTINISGDITAANAHAISYYIGNGWRILEDGIDGRVFFYDSDNSLAPLEVWKGAKKLAIKPDNLIWDSNNVVTEVDYATDLVGGTIKILVVGTDGYITTDGSTPGP